MSYFPILIQLSDGKTQVIHDPKFLPIGIGFKIVEINYAMKPIDKIRSFTQSDFISRNQYCWDLIKNRLTLSETISLLHDNPWGDSSSIVWSIRNIVSDKMFDKLKQHINLFYDALTEQDQVMLKSLLHNKVFTDQFSEMFY
jgi:hypothetical protein